MAKFKDVPFALQKGDNGKETQNSKETLRNMYAEITTTGRAHIVRHQRAGITNVVAQAGEKRCIEKHNGVHYPIIADTLYSFDGATLTTLATLGTATGRCTMIFNDNDEILISDLQLLYYWNGSTVTTVPLPDGVTPGRLSYLNGYGIFNNVGTDQFYITPADDFSQVDPLDFATAESSPDALQCTFVDHNEIYLPGTDTIEIWQDVGGSDFPFQAVTSAKIERGTIAPLSFAAEDNTISFLGNDGIVYRIEAYRPVRISSFAVEEAIRKVSSAGKASAYGLIYTMAGNKFYTLTFPGELTLQYNYATQLWNEANTYGSASWDIVGSNGHNSDYVLTATGISVLDPDVNTDEGTVMVRLARSSPGWAEGFRIFLRALQIDCQVGRVTDPTLEPTVMLRVARDGESFGNVKTRTLGAQGNYRRRVVFRWLGFGTKPVFELSASDDFDFTVIGTLLNAGVANQ